MDFFEELIGFDMLGGFDDNEDLLQRAAELGLDAEDYDTLEELKEAIEELE